MPVYTRLALALVLLTLASCPVEVILVEEAPVAATVAPAATTTGGALVCEPDKWSCESCSAEASEGHCGPLVAAFEAAGNVEGGPEWDALVACVCSACASCCDRCATEW